jgi:hypothetical protein
MKTMPVGVPRTTAQGSTMMFSKHKSIDNPAFQRHCENSGEQAKARHH